MKHFRICWKKKRHCFKASTKQNLVYIVCVIKYIYINVFLKELGLCFFLITVSFAGLYENDKLYQCRICDPASYERTVGFHCFSYTHFNWTTRSNSWLSVFQNLPELCLDHRCIIQNSMQYTKVHLTKKKKLNFTQMPITDYNGVNKINLKYA